MESTQLPELNLQLGWSGNRCIAVAQGSSPAYVQVDMHSAADLHCPAYV